MFEYGVVTHLKNLQDEIKRCTLDILIDKGYTLDKAKEAIDNIKNFNVYEVETGFRIEALVDEYKIIVFHHTDNIKVTFYSEEKDPNRQQKLNTIQVNNEAFNQGRIVSTFEQQTNERLQKLEKCVSDLHSEYTRLVRCNNRNATTLNDLYNTIKNYGCGLSERLLENEQRENPSL